MAKRDFDAERMQRYHQVVQEAVQRETFDVGQVREACGFSGSLVSQVIRLMADDGLIMRVDVGRGKAAFRWTEKRAAFASDEWARGKVYRNRIKCAPPSDRPRERLLKMGVQDLRIADLIAILIRSGNAKESAVQAGERIAAVFHDKLEQLPDSRRGDLKSISNAIGDTAYCQIMAGIELGRRIADLRREPTRRVRIESSDDACNYCAQQFARLASDSRHEEFHIVLLNTRHEPIGTHRVSAGTLDASLVHPREVFRAAIKETAKAIILVHNHPSGDPTPGEQDIRVTKRLNEVAKVVGIDVLDHIVVAQRGTFSLRDHGLGFD